MVVNALVISGYGINCEEETKFAFERAGAKGKIVHINDLIEGSEKLDNYQVLAFPGGFSYGDDTGSGNAFANRIRNNLWDEIMKFFEQDKLVIGICNGFQIMANLGLFPATDIYGKQEVALTHNTSARYEDRWVDLHSENDSPWLRGIESLTLPIAHGEGRFYTDEETYSKLYQRRQIALRYCMGKTSLDQNLEYNPNGSLKDIASITDQSGRIIGMMPHPERAIDFTHLPHWTLIKEKLKREGREIPKEGPGLTIFKNSLVYFK